MTTDVRNPFRWTLLTAGLLLAGGIPGLSATFYRTGELVDNFTLIDRSTAQPVQLQDFEGKIVFLEWFAWWCPFCQAAAPQVDSGIVDWYSSRGGNPDGIPVLHVAVNLQANQEAQTQNFVNRAKFGFVLEDFNRGLANRFQSGGQPIFAIINGVTRSPSHRPWELLLHQDGFGQRDFSESLARFRGAIDAVRAVPPPVPPLVTLEPESVDRVEGESWALKGVASGTPPFTYQWFHDGSVIANATSAEWGMSEAALANMGEYVLRVTNPAGSVDSKPARVVVRPRKIPETRLVVLGWTSNRELRVEVTDAGGGVPVLEHSVDLLDWQVWTELKTHAPRQEILFPANAAPTQFFRVRN